MGKVKSASIKSVVEELIEEHGKKFNDNFEHNKEVLSEVRPISSKRIRNIVAGYITRKIKKRAFKV